MSTKDFKKLRDCFHDGGDLMKLLSDDNVKPNISTCNRLLNDINNSEHDNEYKKKYITNVIDYVDKYQLMKDRGFYNMIVQSLVIFKDVSRQLGYMTEMEAFGHKTKISTYIPLLESCYELLTSTNNMEHYHKMFEILNMIQTNNFKIFDEVFIMFFNAIKYIKTKNNYDGKNDLTQIVVIMSDHIDIVTKDTYDALMSCIDTLGVNTKQLVDINNKTYHTHGLIRRKIPKSVFKSLKTQWLDSFNQPKDAKLIKIHTILKKAEDNILKLHNKKFFDPKKPIALIDGANIGMYVNRGRNDTKTSFFRQINAVVKYFHENNWNVVVFIYHEHLENPETQEIADIINFWKNPYKNIVRYDVKGCNDDYLWILAAFYYNYVRSENDTYFVTNDIMRNHHLGKLTSEHFFLFRQLHQITYNIKYIFNGKKGYNDSDFELTINHVPPYSHFTHVFKNDTSCKLYIPFTEHSLAKRNERVDKEIRATDKFMEEFKISKWQMVEY
jgi:hypothetical protein